VFIKRIVPAVPQQTPATGAAAPKLARVRADDPKHVKPTPTNIGSETVSLIVSPVYPTSLSPLDDFALEGLI
jgi:hypothetical protein